MKASNGISTTLAAIPRMARSGWHLSDHREPKPPEPHPGHEPLAGLESTLDAEGMAGTGRR